MWHASETQTVEIRQKRRKIVFYIRLMDISVRNYLQQMCLSIRGHCPCAYMLLYRNVNLDHDNKNYIVRFNTCFLVLLLSSLSCQILVTSNVEILQEKQETLYYFYLSNICHHFTNIVKNANKYICYATFQENSDLYFNYVFFNTFYLNLNVFVFQLKMLDLVCFSMSFSCHS